MEALKLHNNLEESEYPKTAIQVHNNPKREMLNFSRMTSDLEATMSRNSISVMISITRASPFQGRLVLTSTTPRDEE